ncbi:MAG: outer membrane beta-barrel protein [Betaproteobacteria bacterium]|nr:outer membrane beta-barrel protein [Betaproteobacteria bacterium]
MIRSAIAGALAVGLCASSAAFAADEGNWLVRARATYVDFSNNNSDNVLGADVAAQSKWIPEVDVTYFFTQNIATELVLSVPQKHNISLGGDKIGSLQELPPHLMVQYHLPMGDFKPYAGVGINYTRFWNVDILGGAVDVKRYSWGPSLQLGVDYKIAPQWYLNADIKYTWMNTDVYLGGNTVAKLNLDPWIMSIGVGYRF